MYQKLSSTIPVCFNWNAQIDYLVVLIGYREKRAEIHTSCCKTGYVNYKKIPKVDTVITDEHVRRPVQGVAQCEMVYKTKNLLVRYALCYRPYNKKSNSTKHNAPALLASVVRSFQCSVLSARVQ